MTIRGNIEDIIFKNEDTGYTVLSVKYKNSLVTCVGKIVNVNVGQDVELEGDYVTNVRFGKQFAFSDAKVIEPKSTFSIEKYLASGLISGVRGATAHKIVDKFKEQTLYILEYAPIKLSEIKGISERKALEIGESYQDIKKMQEAVIFLQKYNISTNLSVKIFNVYKEKTKDVVLNNPYMLVENIEGVGFITADKIASKMGIKPDSNFRVRAGILYILRDGCNRKGHTYLPKELVFMTLLRLLKLDESVLRPIFESELKALETDQKINLFKHKTINAICMRKMYFMEDAIASKMVLLKLSEMDVDVDVETEIAEFERVNKITLHSAQKEAIREAVNEQVSIVTGGPGTGKTTIIKCILQALKHYTKKIMLLAPTGRASKRLSETCNYKASTIHRALEVNFREDDIPVFRYNEHNLLPVDVVIVDEMSMVDVSLFSSLLRALPRHCKLILVGDKDQLPSVGAGNVLRDLIASKVITCVKLSHIYRQDSMSLIVVNAHLINNGKMPDLTNKSRDFFYEKRKTPKEMYDCTIDLVTKRLPKFLGCRPEEIQVLCAMKSGVCGVQNLNSRLQALINPCSLEKIELDFEDRILREGDKVMQTINNYDLQWVRSIHGDVEETGKGIFNGDMGKIIKINSQTGETEVLFDDGKRVNYARNEAYELQICYATTIHKSQGSEFDTVVIPIVAGSSQILTRNLLYTAVTRAKKFVVLVGQKRNIARMIFNKYTIERYTMLEDLLKFHEKKSSELYG